MRYSIQYQYNVQDMSTPLAHSLLPVQLHENTDQLTYYFHTAYLVEISHSSTEIDAMETVLLVLSL